MKLAFEVYNPNNTQIYSNPIILHHGITEDKRTWRALGQPLAQLTGRKVYAVDARNHGESPWTNEYNYDVMTADLEEFLEDHGIRKIILVGHSMGGKVAFNFALKNPEKVEKLVVEDVPVRDFKYRHSNQVSVGMDAYKMITEQLKQISGKAEQEKYFRELVKLFSNVIKISPQLIDSYDVNLMPVKWNGNFYEVQLNQEVILETLIKNKLQKDLEGKFEGETLFLYGAASQFRANQDPSIEKLFPRTKKVEFKNAGHFIHHTFPKEFLEEVVRFINKENSITSKY